MYNKLFHFSLLILVFFIISTLQVDIHNTANAETSQAQFRGLVEKARSHESLSRDEVDTVESLAKLRILRNAVYAGHGDRFNSPDLGSYFSQYKWFKPRHASVKDML